MNKEQIETNIEEILKKVNVIYEYFKENQKYENAAKMRDIELLLRTLNIK